MSELQSVVRDEKIMVDALVKRIFADLEPLAMEKNIKLDRKMQACDDDGKRYSYLQTGI